MLDAAIDTLIGQRQFDINRAFASVSSDKLLERLEQLHQLRTQDMAFLQIDDQVRIALAKTKDRSLGCFQSMQSCAPTRLGWR